MQPNKIMYIDLPNPLPKSYAPKKGEEMNRSTYSTMRYTMVKTYYSINAVALISHIGDLTVFLEHKIYFELIKKFFSCIDQMKVVSDKDIKLYLVLKHIHVPDKASSFSARKGEEGGMCGGGH